MFKKTRPIPPTLTAALAKIRDGIAAGLIPIDMAELDAMVDYCEEFAQRKVDEGDTMPKHYMACLSMYSMEFYAERSLYSVVNEHLRAKDRKKVEPISDYVWLLMHAMSLCPPFVERVVFRGVKDLSPDAYKEGDIITWCQFSSTAATVKVQNTFLGQTGVRTLFMIELTTDRAREIHIYSDYPDEKEVLLPPNSRFVVVSVYAPGGGLVNVHLREVAPTDPILVFGSLDAATATTTTTAMPPSMPSPPSPIGATSSAPPPPPPPSGEPAPLTCLPLHNLRQSCVYVYCVSRRRRRDPPSGPDGGPSCFAAGGPESGGLRDPLQGRGHHGGYPGPLRL